ncbi:hypothetical protein GCM10023115_32300 [Pontixanthobacter gangjinensis]
MLGQKRPDLYTYQNIDIELKNGGSLKGVGKINLIGELIYRPEEDAEKRKVEREEVKTFEISNDSSSRSFEYKHIQGPNFIGEPLVLLEKLEAGKIELFRKEMTQQVSMGPGMGSMPRTVIVYYLSKPGENTAEHIKSNTYSRKFRKNATGRFPNCPELVNKIKNKAFDRYSIREIVKFYNTNCP